MATASQALTPVRGLTDPLPPEQGEGVPSVVSVELLEFAGRVARKYLVRYEDIEDAAMEAVLRFMTREQRGGRIECPQAYIRDCAKTAALDIARRRHQDEVSLYGGDGLRCLGSTDGGLGALVDWLDIESAMAEMGDSRRWQILDLLVAGQGRDVMAKHLGVSLGVARNFVMDLRRDLRAACGFVGEVESPTMASAAPQGRIWT